MSLFQKKSLSEVREEAGKTKLKKNLGAMDLILLGIGAIIGTGIFVLTGLAAAQYAGPAVTVSFFLGAVACIFTALAYSELASMLPVSGSAYSYAYVSVGEFAAAMVGWTVLMVFTFGGATVAAGWSGYIVGVLNDIGLNLPVQLTKIPADGGVINLPAVFIVSFLTFLLFRGTKEATWLNGVLVAVKLLAIALFLFTAVPHINPVHWQDFAPNGIWGIGAGAGFLFMAYTGFDTLSMAAEECKNPNRDLPIGIIGSLTVSAILYVIVSGVLTGIVSYKELNIAEPMAYALRVNGVNVGARIVAAGALAGMTTVLLTQIFGQSRILLVMARDGLMPAAFNRVHHKYVSPYMGVLVTGFAMALLSGFISVGTLGKLSSMATLIIFAFVSCTVIVMRVQKPDERRPFRCPAVYFVSSVSVILCSALFLQLLPENWLAYLLITLIWPVIYFGYGIRNSTLRNLSK